MPLFGSTFSPKKTPPRKSASLSNLHNLDRSTREVELGLDYGTPTMNLAGQSLKFENGQWIAETGISGGVDRREAQRLRRRNQQLEEENNLLRLKVDILLDMSADLWSLCLSIPVCSIFHPLLQRQLRDPDE
uniref:Chibby 1, beta catenin antagonist n=1 Tax=Bos taurus TaxID=9913 RepID=A0AAA9SQ26_BOVIN